MKNYRLISSILSKPWLINPDWVNANLPLISQLISGETIVTPFSKPSAFDQEDENERRNKENEAESNYDLPKVITVKGGVIKSSFYGCFDEAPEGSIAIVPVIGPISKYYDCGIPGSTDMARWVDAASKSAKIDGIILDMDTPGGMVDGTATLADAVKNSTKPTTAFINDGMAASAGMWVASAADRIILSQPTDAIGSIGVFTTLADYRGFFEQKGIKLHEIYAPQSTNKNKDYREALEGRYTLVLEDLEFLAARFIEVIKTNRGDKLNSEFDVFTGKMFYADDAIKAGLADEIGNIEFAIESTYSRVGTKNATKSTSNNMALFSNKFKVLNSMANKESKDITEQDVDAANAELKDNGVTGLVLVNASELAEYETEMGNVQSKLTAAETAKGTAETALTAEKKAHDATRHELAALKTKTTGATTIPTTGAEDKMEDKGDGGNDEFDTPLTKAARQSRESVNPK